MTKSNYLLSKEREYPQWNILRPRKIIRCSLTGADAWYKDMVGTTIKVKQFGTFGAWDESNRWVAYWDLS